MSQTNPPQPKRSTPAVEVRRVIDGEDDIGRACSFTVTIGRRAYVNGAVVVADRERGWRRLLRRYARPRLYLGHDLEDRLTRDADLLQVVAAALVKAV
jgi:hypothetical protein